MTSSDHLDDADLDRLLSVPPAMAHDEARAALLRQTTRVLRRRRRMHRVVFAAACAACYLAGLGTMLLTQRSTRAEQQPLAARQDVPEATSPDPERFPAEESTPQIAGQGPETESLTAESSRLRAHREELSQFESLRRLGDRYLLERNDPEGAVRCYKMALRAATPEERQFHADQGTWLFQALRQDFTTERKHDQQES